MDLKNDDDFGKLMELLLLKIQEVMDIGYGNHI